MSLSEGSFFGEFRVVRRLGKGGMGEVWLLRSPMGEEVAAKLLDEASSADHAARKRFLREAELAMGVKHPNLVETYDVGEDPDTGLCYILMEYMPGGTLADHLKDHGAMKIDDAVSVVRAMASVLELSRQSGIVHRDIKPANIMFDAEGTPKLADLGIARRGAAGEDTTTLTQTGMMIGTPAYMAPEQMLDAHNVDTRADIYSLGIVFYEMLTGVRPNKDDTVVQILAKAVAGEPIPDVRTLRPEVSAALAQLLNMMTVPDKEGRISTPGQITNALDIIIRTGGFEMQMTVSGKPAAGRRMKSGAATGRVRAKGPHGLSLLFWKVLVSAGIVLCLGAAVVVYMCRKSPSRRTSERPAVAESSQPARLASAVQSEKVTVPASSVNAATRTNEVAVSPHVAGETAKDGLEWIEKCVDAKELASLRICFDMSHGYFRFPGNGADLHFLTPSRDIKCKSCWHDLATENLADVNLLVLGSTEMSFMFSDSRLDALSHYDDAECAVIDTFLREGGTVLVVAHGDGGDLQQKNKLLGRYGLRVVAANENQRRESYGPPPEKQVRSNCPAFADFPAAVAFSVSAIQKQNDDKDTIWVSILESADTGDMVVATKSVGKGRLLFVPEDLCRYGRFRGQGNLEVVKFLRSLVCSAVKARKIAPDMPMSQRSITDAPVVLEAGPVKLCTATRFKAIAEKLRDMVQTALPHLERYCGEALVPDEMATTMFVLASGGPNVGTFPTVGDKAMAIKATFCGFPKQAVRLPGEVLKLMVTKAVGDDRMPWLSSYIALLALEDIGFPQMEQAVTEVRKRDRETAKVRCISGDGPVTHLQAVDENGKRVGMMWDVARARFFSAFEEIRAKHPDFIPAYCKCAREYSKHHKLTQDLCIALLSEVVGEDCYPYFERNKIECVRESLPALPGAESDRQVGKGSPRQLARTLPPAKSGPNGNPETKIIFPILDRSPAAWSYSFEEERGWASTGFDDSKWERAPGGFGARESMKHIRYARLNTKWSTERLFLRKRFQWDGRNVSRAVATVFHDDSAQIWLNGRLVMTLSGSNTEWKPIELPVSLFSNALKEGDNLLCVEVRNEFGAGYFDCGLTVECGGGAEDAEVQDGERKVKTAEGTWTIVVKSGVAQIGDGRNVALEPAPKGALRIPSHIGGLRVRRLSPGSFRDCTALQCVEIPEGVRSVGEMAFMGCARLTKIDLPTSLEHVGHKAFAGARGIKRIDLKNVGLIESEAFAEWCDIETIAVGRDNAHYFVKDGVLFDRARRALVLCPRSMRSYTIPSNVEEIAPCAFHRSNLKSIVIPASVSLVGCAAFNGCSRLEKVVFKGDDANIQGGAFSDTPLLSSVVLPSRLKMLDDWAIFHGSGIEKIVLPDTLEIIDDAVFEDCQKLRQIEFGKSLKEVRHHAFARCQLLEKVKFPATLEQMGSRVFLACKGLKSVEFMGGAPVLCDQGQDSFGYELYKDANPHLVTVVPRKAEGWKNQSGALPRVWPANGGESSRKIMYAK